MVEGGNNSFRKSRSMIRIGLMQSLLVGISLIIATLIGEVVVRLMAPQELGIWIYTRDGMTSHFPNIRQYSYKFGHEIVTNSVGMRDREHAVGKQDGVFRILVLGDSFMEANQVKFDDSFLPI